MPGDRYYRRGHWVRMPAPRRRTSGMWFGLALAAFLGWGLLNGCTAEETDAPHGPRPAPSASSAESR
ncbi:hypothetical protein ABZ752_01550 [Streptomyces roseifaciens]